MLDGGLGLPGFQQIQLIDSTVILVHAWDIDFIKELDLWWFVWVIGPTVDFETINSVVEDSLNNGDCTLQGPKMVPFQLVRIQKYTSIQPITDHPISNTLLTFLEFLQQPEFPDKLYSKVNAYLSSISPKYQISKMQTAGIQMLEDPKLQIIAQTINYKYIEYIFDQRMGNTCNTKLARKEKTCTKATKSKNKSGSSLSGECVICKSAVKKQNSKIELDLDSEEQENEGYDKRKGQGNYLSEQDLCRKIKESKISSAQTTQKQRYCESDNLRSTHKKSLQSQQSGIRFYRENSKLPTIKQMTQTKQISNIYSKIEIENPQSTISNPEPNENQSVFQSALKFFSLRGKQPQ